MDTELKTIYPEEEINSASICNEGEEISVCNCENEEIVTLCACDEGCEETCVEETKKEKLLRKCNEVKEACRSTASRLAEDW